MPIDRYAIFTWLHYHEFTVPSYGTVQHLCLGHDMKDYCVVWSNGESQRMRLVDAYKEPDSYAVMYTGRVGFSVKFIQIGADAYWVEYTSNDNWKSNRGKFSTWISRAKYNNYHPIVNMPMFSIDYVVDHAKYYAVDFDVYPGIRGTGLEKIIHRKQAAELIRDAMKHFGV